MQTSPITAINTFRRDDRGSIMMTFGVMFMMIVMCAGVGIDFARVSHSHSRLGMAADAAAIAAGKALLDGRNSDSDIQRIATEYFKANFKAGEGYANVHAFTARLDRTTNTVNIDIDAEVPMTLTKIAGVTKFDLPIRSVATFNQKDIEVGLQLDLTGSMGGRKIADLRAATADLIDILLPDQGTTNRVRIALAPYSSGVNLGTYARTVTDGRNGPSNCVYDRPGLLVDTDAPPAANAFFQGRVDLPRAEACPASPIVPLNSDKRILKNEVSRFRDGGWTAGQLGTMFAWATISPNWNNIWPAESEPAPYGDGKTNKVAILMTDGEYNTYDGRPGNTPLSNQHARAMCTNMKKEGVIVYTIGFEINVPSAITTLTQCATSPDKFFRAENGAELRAAFANIALQINNLRISK